MAFLAGAMQAAAVLAASAGSVADEPPGGSRRCAQRAESPGGLRGLHDKANLRIGPVVFFGLGRSLRLERTPGRDLSLKSGIAVRAGAPVLLRIPRGARRRIALEYAANRDGSFPDVRRVRQGQVLVRVIPCDPDTPRFSDGGRIGLWTAFPGGFVLKRPGCYPIEVARQGRPFQRRRVAFAKPCD